MLKRTLLVLPILFLASCASPAATPAIQSPTQTQPQRTATQPVSPEPEFDPLVISPENIGQMELVNRIGKGSVFDFDLSPDGETLAVSTATGVYLYDVQTGLEIPFIDNPFLIPIHGGETPGPIAFSPDGKYLAFANETIRIWNFEEERIERSFNNIMVDFRTTHLEFGRTGRQLILQGLRGPEKCDGIGGNFQIYDIQNENQLFYRLFCPESSQFFFHTATNGLVYFIGVDPENRLDYETTIVEEDTGDIVQRISNEFAQPPYDISDDGFLMAVTKSLYGSRLTNVIEIASGRIVDTVEGQITFLPGTDNVLANITRTDRVGWELINLGKASLCEFSSSNRQLSYSMEVFQSHFIHDERYMVVSNRVLDEIQIWDTSTCELELIVPFPVADIRLDISPDSTIISTVAYNSIALWSVNSGELSSTVRGQDGLLFPIATSVFHPHKPEIVVATNQDPYVLTYFDMAEFTDRIIMTNSANHPRHIAIDPAGEILAMSSGGGFSLWQYGAEAHYFSSEYFSPSGLSFSPDGNSLALFNLYTSNSGVVFVDPITGSVQEKLELADITKFAITQDWSYFAFLSSSDRKIDIWDVEEGRILDIDIRHIHQTPEYFNILGILFSPDSRLLVSYEENLIRFWDTHTGELLAEFETAFSIHEIAFSPDGHYMATTGDDGTIRIWAIVYTYEP